MNQTNLTSSETNFRPTVDSQFSTQKYEGIYHSNSINKSPELIYPLLKDEAQLQKIFSDLPEDLKNFLDLEFVGSNSVGDGKYEVKWKNKGSAEIQGTLTLTIERGPVGKGSTIIANAIFGDYSMDSDGPSDLINVFLKRLKALSETGQLATIKGQPNGKDESEMKKQQH